MKATIKYKRDTDEFAIYLEEGIEYLGILHVKSIELKTD